MCILVYVYMWSVCVCVCAHARERAKRKKKRKKNERGHRKGGTSPWWFPFSTCHTQRLMEWCNMTTYVQVTEACPLKKINKCRGDSGLEQVHHLTFNTTHSHLVWVMVQWMCTCVHVLFTSNVAFDIGFCILFVVFRTHLSSHTHRDAHTHTRMCARTHTHTNTHTHKHACEDTHMTWTHTLLEI